MLINFKKYVNLNKLWLMILFVCILIRLIILILGFLFFKWISRVIVLKVYFKIIFIYKDILYNNGFYGRLICGYMDLC